MIQKAVHRRVRTPRMLFFLLLVATQAFSQATAQRLTMEEAVTAALAGNRELLLSVRDEKIAAARYRETQAVFLPQAALSYSAVATDNPLNAFGMKLQQQSITQADFNPALLNGPGATTGYTTRIDVQQPLINVDQLYLRKSASLQAEAYRLKMARTREWLAFEVEKAYRQAQLARASIDVWERALQAANELYRYTSDRVGQGLLLKPDALNAKVQVSVNESNCASASDSYKNACDYLSYLMGRAAGAVYTLDADSLQAEARMAADGTVPAARADFAAMKKFIEASDIGIRAQRMSVVPRLNAFGSWQLSDSRAFGFGAHAWMAGIQLSWDIFKGNSTKNKIATQAQERNKLADQLAQQEAQSALELNKAQRLLGDAGYRMRQQQAAVENAAESLRILNDRYEQGLARSADVLMAQTQLSQQRLALLQAIFDRRIAGAYIQFLTTTGK